MLGIALVAAVERVDLRLQVGLYRGLPKDDQVVGDTTLERVQFKGSLQNGQTGIETTD